MLTQSPTVQRALHRHAQARRRFRTMAAAIIATDAAVVWAAHRPIADHWALDQTARAVACLGAVVLGYLWEQRHQSALALRASVLVAHLKRDA